MEVLDGVHPESAGAGEQEIESQEQQVVTTAVVADEAVEVEKTLYDAEEFLSNYAILREENEHLKQSNQQLEEQLEKARQELEELRIDKDKLEGELVQERQENKEALWKLREDYQKIQEDRLQWKEKYLNIYMKNADGSTDGEVSRNKKRKMNDGDSDMFSNIGFMNDQNQQPVRRHTNQLWDPETKRFECKECKATFRMFSNLKSHIEKNKCVKYTYQCPQCSIVFSNAASFTKHLRYHLGKNCVCAFCGDKFMHEKGLQRHIKMYHTENTQRFQCQYCPKIFARKNLLENHIRRHFNYRPFKCSFCEKSFKTRQYLTGHVNGVHKNDKQFVCDKCDARFSWRTTWKRHMENHATKGKKGIRKKKGNKSNDKLLTVHADNLSMKPNLLKLKNTVLTVHTSRSLPDLQNALSQNVIQFTRALPDQLTNETFALHNPQIATLHLPTNLAQLPQNIAQLQSGVAQLTQGVSPLAHSITQLPQVLAQLPQQLTQSVNQLTQTVDIQGSTLSELQADNLQSVSPLPMYTVSQQIVNEMQQSLDVITEEDTEQSVADALTADSNDLTST